MTVKGYFEDFASGAGSLARPEAAPTHGNTEQAVKAPDASFDAGYASGWDDAVRASQERGERISAELERTIQDLGFSYHEALDQLRGQFLDAFSGLLDALIPDAMAEILQAQLEATLSSQTARPPEIEIVVPEEQVPLFEKLWPEDLIPTAALVADDTLGPDQAYIRTGQQETLIDVALLVAEFKQQILALRDTSERAKHAG